MKSTKRDFMGSEGNHGGLYYEGLVDEALGQGLEMLAMSTLPDEAMQQLVRHLDDSDVLKEFRNEFLFPWDEQRQRECIYLCGNSLGLQPKATREAIEVELKKWAELGVEGHFAETGPWVTVDEWCIEAMAKVVGATKPNIEVALMNTLSVNLHLMMVAFYQPTHTRHKILIEKKAFPSDYHVVKSQIKYHGFDPLSSLVELTPELGEYTLDSSAILQVIEEQGDEIALVMLSGVQYYTGQLYDIKHITLAAHAKGCKVGFDLAHAVGNVPLALHDWGPDFAVWCTYKYLNSGPGGIGGCFVHQRHANDFTLPRFSGWWGHRKEDRFLMSPDFIPTPGALGFQLSNPSVLCLASLKASLELFEKASMSRLRYKAKLLTGLLEYLIKSRLHEKVQIITPADPEQRGCQLSLIFSAPIEEVHQRITKDGVICDLRKPNVMRIAPCPLYNSFNDVFEFINRLCIALR